MSPAVLFVEDNIPDLQSFLAAVRAGVEVIVLDSTRDGLAQIAASLEGRSDIGALHIVSHGSAGEAHLGSLTLSKASIDVHAGLLGRIGDALSSDADILLYGCATGAGADGQALLSSLSTLTRADVAASDDATGGAARGGNWVLEQASGNIATASPFAGDSTDPYAYLLGSTYGSNPLSTTQMYVAARPGQEGTNWVNKGSTAAPGYENFSLWVDGGQYPASYANGLRGTLEYNTGDGVWRLVLVEYASNGNITSTNGGTAAPLNAAIRYIDGRPNDTTTTYSAHAKYVNAQGAVSTTSGFIMTPDLAPTAVTVNTLDFWGAPAAGTALASLGQVDTGSPNDGLHSIVSQSVPGLFAVSGTSLVRGSGPGLAPGQTATVTVRYSDLFDRNADGTPIANQGATQTFTFTGRENPEGFHGAASVNTTAALQQNQPSLARLSDGSYVMIWRSAGQGADAAGSYGIYGRKLDAAGNPTGAEFAISDQTIDTSENTPAVTALDNGRYVVAYAKTSAADVVFRLVDANGALGLETALATSTANSQTTPVLTKLANGGFAAAWNDAGSTDVKTRVFNADGSQASAELTANLTTAGTQAAVAIGALDNGSFVVTWRDPANGNDIIARVFNASGSGGSEIVVAGSAAPQNNPKVAGLSNGGFVLVYQEAGATAGGFTDSSLESNIYAQVYTSAGAAVGGKILVNAATAGNQITPAVIAQPNGGFTVAWTSNADPAKEFDVFARSFNADGSARDSYDLLVNEAARGASQSAPSLAGFDTAGFLAAWYDAGSDAGGGVMVRAFAPANRAPTLAGGAELVSIDEDVPSADIEDLSGGNPPNWGEDIVDLLARSGFADADGHAPLGVAISGNAANPVTEGRWQYSIDPYAKYWYDVGTVSPAAALLLGTTDVTAFIRFVPVADFHGRPGGLTIHAVDETGATLPFSTWDDQNDTLGPRGSFDTTQDDATSPVSATGVTWSVVVTPLNDKPVLVNISAADNQTVAASAAAIAIDLGSDALVGDIDSADFQAGALNVLLSGQQAGDMLFFKPGGPVTVPGGMVVNSSVFVDGVRVGFLSQNGTGVGESLVVIFDTANATPARTTTLLREILFDTTSSVAGARNIHVVVGDGDGTSSEYYSTTITVTTNPTVAISSNASSVKAGSTATISLAFSDIPTGAESADFSVTGGTLGALTQDTQNLKLYTAQFTPASGFQGNASVSIAAGKFKDAGGRDNEASSVNASFIVDTVAPSLTITSDRPSLAAGQSASITFTFDEVPDGFTSASVVAHGGTLVNLAPTANPKVYQAAFIPASDSQNVAALIEVAPGAYTDAAGNGGGAASLTLNGDTKAPTLTIGAASTTLRAGDQTTLSFTFSEAPLGFAEGDIAVSGGTLSGFGATADPKVYSASFTPVASNALAASVSVPGGAYTDAIGNPGAASNTLNLAGDTLAPLVTIGASRNVFKAGESATLTFTFNDTPLGFDHADIVATGGVVGALVPTADSKVFTATFTPTDGMNALSGSVRVAAGGVMDASGNFNPASNVLSFSGDTRSPVVTDAQLSVSGATGTGGAFKAGDTITASWNNGSTGDNNPDIGTVSVDLSAFGGSATAAAILQNGVWSASYTIGAGSVDASGRNVSVHVVDVNGNATTRADSSNATLDNQAPTVGAAAIVLAGATGNGAVFRIGDTVTATWNNSASGDNNGDIAAASFDFAQFGGGMVAATQNAGVWSASHTIAAGTPGTSGLGVSVTATDDAGNSRTQASAAQAALDALRPAVSSISLNGTPGPAATAVDFTVVFSESVSGVDLSDFALATGGQASGRLAGISGSGTTWTVSVDNIAGRGTVGLNLQAGGTGIVDAAGNEAAGAFTGATHASGINAAPVISSNGGGGSAQVDLAEGQTAVTTVVASDSDNDGLQYRISGGGEASLFTIGADGKLRFVTAPSAAAPDDSNHDGVYDVQVTVSDQYGGSVSQFLWVNVLRDLDGDALPDIHDDDIDNDGRLNSAEDPVPGALGVLGDGNGDGVADSRQANVASLATAVTGNPFATLEVAGNYTLTSVSAGPVPTGLPRNVKLPLGQLDFSINGVSAGGTVEVAIYVDAGQKVNSYFKLDNTGKWVNIAKSVSTVGSKTRITFDLKDGGPLDSDGVANGRIVDPGGVALVTPLITSNGGTREASVTLVEGGRTVTTATASLPVTWSLGGADAALFTVDAGTGALSFRAAPAYGQPLDTGGIAHDNIYLLDLIASDANGSDTQSLKVTVQQYVAPPVVQPVPVTIDGVPVSTGTVANGDGSVSSTITIPVVAPTRPEQVGNNTVADIPLASSNGQAILTAQVPTGYGLQVSSSGVQSAGNSLTDLIREIKAHTAAGSHDQNSLTGGGSGFLADLPVDTPLLVQTIVPMLGSGAGVPGEALVLSGSPSASGSPMTALVIDTSGLASGVTLQLQNVEFAAIIGAARVTGGAGSQKVWGDSAAQTLFLGADDDILHGGGGDDVVGSAGGNDRIYGDEGNDIVFGGQGDDAIDGGTGRDTVRLMGAGRAEYTMRIKDGAVVMTHLKPDADGIDIVANVELLQYSGQAGAVDFNGSEIAGLVRMYSTAFGRNADTDGINFWIEAHEKGSSMMQIAHAFLASTEGKAGFDMLSNRDFVTKLYDVAMDRVASEVEVDYWTQHLDRGVLDRGEVLYHFSTSEEKVDLVGVVNTSITTI
ncbi:Ig-like domain-containing protein [Massilia sp. IC2-477]|uniref:Ig-like domain-containing protein n=1 Tax=Massilia sp. IC2-477 TaxID=2887198 RepID=UPI001D0FD852